jgi:hypothetical protein
MEKEVEFHVSLQGQHKGHENFLKVVHGRPSLKKKLINILDRACNLSAALCPSTQ